MTLASMMATVNPIHLNRAAKLSWNPGPLHRCPEL